jgi:hypothetical protein
MIAPALRPLTAAAASPGNQGPGYRQNLRIIAYGSITNRVRRKCSCPHAEVRRNVQ